MKIIESQIDKKRLIYFSIIVMVFLLLLILFFINLVNGNSNKNSNRVIASVDGFAIYEKDLEDRLKILSPDKKLNIEEIPESILKAMVLEVAVNNKMDKEALKLRYQNDPKIKELVNSYRKSLIRERYINEKIYINIDEEKALNEYNKLIKNLNGKEERKIKHILVDNEEEIDRVRRNVMRSGNFEKVAREKSMDVASAENGGDIGYILKEELVPEFGDIAFILKIGEVSKPVKTQYGWHIIKVEDVREAQFLPFEQVKDGIKQKLQQESIQNYLLSLTKDSKINFKIDLKKLPKESNNN